MIKVTTHKKEYRLVLLLFLISCIAYGVYSYVEYINKEIPDKIYINAYTDDAINIDVPFLGTIDVKNDIGEAREASVNLMNPLTISSGETSEYTMEVRFLGLFHIKDIEVTVSDGVSVAAGGIPVGIYIETDGVLVIDIGQVKTSSGLTEAPSQGIIAKGDYILSVNGNKVSDKEQLISYINSCGENYANLEIRRDGEIFTVRVKPVKSSDESYKIGVWVRDDCQGLGTLTYVEKNGDFGTLGHAISDSDTGKIVEIERGRLYTAKIWSIVKSEEGIPGEVIGSINYSSSNYLGEITENSSIGIYGKCSDNIFAYIDEVYIEVGYKQNIEIGEACIKTCLEGKVREFDIYIDDVDFSTEASNKGIVFHVTDEELLEKTGGIVQGYSGSPIIQNGKIIGAVTHVFVDEPQRGYGIFIEEMLE